MTRALTAREKKIYECGYSHGHLFNLKNLDWNDVPDDIKSAMFKGCSHWLGIIVKPNRKKPMGEIMKDMIAPKYLNSKKGVLVCVKKPKKKGRK